jgi:SAM-dependent methyltransferase
MYNSITNWLNSGEYRTDIDDMRTTIMRDARNSNSESTTASIFERELYYLIRSKTGFRLDFTKEQRIDNIMHKFGYDGRPTSRGRLDSVVNYLVIEYKHYTKLETREQYNTAVLQVEEYLSALLINEKIKYNAVLTDGIRICYFSYVGTELRHSVLAPISNDDIDIIVQAILFNDKKKFVPTNILQDFAIDHKTESISKTLAVKLYEVLKNNATPKTEMLYEEWKSLMHLSVEDNGKGNDIDKRRKELSLIFSDDISRSETEYRALYALQTTYAIIVKLIACKVIDKLEYNDLTNSYHDLTSVSSMDLQKFFEKMEDGYSYRSSNIFNLLEGDFFSWYSDKDQWSAELWKITICIVGIIDQYSAFSFNLTYEPIDIFKDLYMSIIPRSVRHSMGEYFTPEWLADYVVSQGLHLVDNPNWKAIDPCCGSGIFLIALIKHIVGDINIQSLSPAEKLEIQRSILQRVFGIDISPLAVLSARVGYYLALLPFGALHDIEIPVYLGDSAIVPTKVNIDGNECYSYTVSNTKLPFNILLPARLVEQHNFGNLMNQLQACVKTENSEILFAVLFEKLPVEEQQSDVIIKSLKDLSDNLTTLHKNHWDGIWVRISTNFMMIARLTDFDFIVGNPPWVKWEHLPAIYANKIKQFCNIKHIFSNDGGQFGGTQLNICALISNVTATNWLTPKGVLAFLMPDSIMSQNSYEEFRNFYIDYEKGSRLYLQGIDRWLKPLRPFWCGDKPVSQDFNTYFFAYNYVDYKKGIPVNEITRKRSIKDAELNQCNSFRDIADNLLYRQRIAKQLSNESTAFSYINYTYDYSQMIGPTAYLYRTGVEFTPQELYMLVGISASEKLGNYKFASKKFSLSKYTIEDTPVGGWDFQTKHVYPIVTGPNVEPFKYTSLNEFCIIPYDPDNTKVPIDVRTMMSENKELFNYLLGHKDIIDRQSEKSKMKHRGDEFYALSKIGPYTFARNIVAARDNSKFCATVVKPSITPWGEEKSSICVKHTIIISQDITGRFITEDEAYYICGILNSDIVVNYIQNTFKSNGYSLNKSHIFLPLFDPSNSLHQRICQLAKKASGSDTTDINRVKKELTAIYLEICLTK